LNLYLHNNILTPRVICSRSQTPFSDGGSSTVHRLGHKMSWRVMSAKSVGALYRRLGDNTFGRQTFGQHFLETTIWATQRHLGDIMKLSLFYHVVWRRF